MLYTYVIRLLYEVSNRFADAMLVLNRRDLYSSAVLTDLSSFCVAGAIPPRVKLILVPFAATRL